VYDLKLVSDKIFWMKLLPKVTGGLLTFLGEGMQRGESWEQCRARVLKEYFPLFVRETLIRELVVFNFHKDVPCVSL
jgi:hypothetical protein